MSNDMICRENMLAEISEMKFLSAFVCL